MDPEYTRYFNLIQKFDLTLEKIRKLKHSIERRAAVKTIREIILPKFKGISCKNVHGGWVQAKIRSHIEDFVRKKGLEEVLRPEHYTLDVMQGPDQKISVIAMYLSNTVL